MQTITIEGDNDRNEVNGNQPSVLVILPGIVREGCSEEGSIELESENVGRRTGEREMFSRLSRFPEECK